jgi:hypothetical protein
MINLVMRAVMIDALPIVIGNKLFPLIFYVISIAFGKDGDRRKRCQHEGNEEGNDGAFGKYRHFLHLILPFLYVFLRKFR